MKHSYFKYSQVHKNPIAAFFKRIMLLIIFILIITSLLILTGFVLHKKIILETNTITVPNLPKDLESYTILHISDLNGNMELVNTGELTNLLKGKRFQAVSLTGEMLGKNAKAFETLIQILQNSNKNIPIIYLPSANEQTQYENELLSENIESEYIHHLVNTYNIIYLDRPISLKYNKTSLWFSPEYLYNLDPESTLSALTGEIHRIEQGNNLFNEETSKLYKKISYRSRIMEDAIIAKKAISPNEIQIALSSVPLNQEYISNAIRLNDSTSNFALKNASLVLSGGLVGGQWCLPGGQPLYAPGYGLFPNKNEIYGLNRILTINQYISTGLGTLDIYPYFSFRIFNPPTISLLKLSTKY